MKEDGKPDIAVVCTYYNRYVQRPAVVRWLRLLHTNTHFAAGHFGSDIHNDDHSSEYALYKVLQGDKSIV